jgi:uncharacterized SAM-binding protein YcdF (DUF218 family)
VDRPASRFIPIARWAIPLCILAVIAAYRWWLPQVGEALVENDGPAKADIGVVLGGDYWGDRIEKAAQLIQQGYIPQALVSGPPGFYGYHECDLAIPFVVRRGYPEAGFVALPHDALSTETEAHVVLAELRRRNVRSYLLITSDYHTRRAARTFRHVARSMGYEPAVRVVAAPDRLFHLDRWWHWREGQKAVFFEWSKTLAFTVGL